MISPWAYNGAVHMKEKKNTASVLSGAYMLIVLVIVLLPLLICLMNSFKSTSELIHGFMSLPKEISLENYQYVITQKHIFRFLFNSLLISSVGVFICFLINPYVSYIISINWSKRVYRLLYFALSACMFIPGNLLIFPLIKLYYRLGLMNIGGLFLYYAVFMIPENVFMLVPYFRTFNRDYLDAAFMDGCSVLKFYRRVFLPVCKPFVLAILILNTVWIWNDFLMPLMILNKDPDMWTMPIFIYNFLGRNSAHKNYAFASCQIALTPIIVFYVIFRNRIIEGLRINSSNTFEKKGVIRKYVRN